MKDLQLNRMSTMNQKKQLNEIVISAQIQKRIKKHLKIIKLKFYLIKVKIVKNGQINEVFKITRKAL